MLQNLGSIGGNIFAIEPYAYIYPYKYLIMREKYISEVTNKDRQRDQAIKSTGTKFIERMIDLAFHHIGLDKLSIIRVLVSI